MPLLSVEVVDDCNFMASVPTTRYFENRRPLQRFVFIRQVGELLRAYASFVLRWPPLDRWRWPKDRLAFFYLTENNIQSLEPVRRESAEPSVYFSTKPTALGIGLELPAPPIAFFSLLFLPITLFRFATASGHRRLAYKASFLEYAITPGIYYWALLFFRRVRPRGVVFANDHVMQARVLRLVCSNLGIPTFFVPHAVQDPACTPRLEFDYAFLQGRAASDEYARAGMPSGVVYEVGVPRFDEFRESVNTTNQTRSVGLCCNLFTDAGKLDVLIQLLREDLGEVRTVVRPHPAHAPQELLEVAARAGATVSVPSEESSFEFLAGVDAIVAGDSGILLEAALMNVYPIYWSGLGEGNDMLGFVASGLADEASDPDDVACRLREILDARPYVRDRARRYVANVGSPYEGRAAEMVAEMITAALEGAPVSPGSVRSQLAPEPEPER